MSLRHDWTLDEVEQLFALPFWELAYQAQTAHRAHQDPGRVQLCTLSNIKRGGCSEDCGYCPQAARYDTGIKGSGLAAVDEVREQARRAVEAGTTRFCMGAAWREVKDGPRFDQVLELVEAVAETGMEVCATLGMVNEEQARRLRAAGLTAYNHNIDTSPEHYANVITTRTFDDRLRTLDAVRAAGLTVCCGGIVGLGETVRDRARMLQVLANLTPHPESVPINKLVRAPGTPLEGEAPVDTFDWLRTIAVARVVMPASMVRLAAGRSELSREAMTLAFLLGANSIFYGEELLTTPNADTAADQALLGTLGLAPLEARPLPPEGASAR